MGQYHVVRWAPSLPLPLLPPGTSFQDTLPFTFNPNAGNTITLVRDVGGTDVVADSNSFGTGKWLQDTNGIAYSLQRDITPAKCIMRLWDSNTNGSGSPTLGIANNYNTIGDMNYIQAHPKNGPFTNIGEIGMIFRKPAYYFYQPGGSADPNVIGYSSSVDKEYQVRLNLADPNFQKIFKYLTVIDPNNFYPNDPNYANETRIKGRININTAPAYVLAQLPWVSLRSGTYNDPNLAKAIVAYRDKSEVRKGDANYPNYTGSDPCGFRNIGQLCNVVSGNDDFGIDYYSRGSMTGNQTGFPDLTPDDNAPDDFEERDLIFARISDLVTVRSDMFTAYILVRIGVDGPQKRCITILDRSGVKDPNDRVYIRAFQTTPEAR
jgi:hypothetical protein